MTSTTINSNNPNTFAYYKEIEDVFYSSLDSDDDKEENEKKPNLRKSTKTTRLTGMAINQNDIYTIDKRKSLIKKFRELKRNHQMKTRRIKQEHVTWELVYRLLFYDHFNLLKHVHESPSVNIFTSPSTNKVSPQKEIIFNKKELELRMKKLLDKVNTKDTNVYLCEGNNNININNNEQFDNSFTKDNNETSNTKNEIIEISTTDWIDTPLTSFMKPNPFALSEQNNYMPSYLTAFSLSLEKELSNISSSSSHSKKKNCTQHQSSNSSSLGSGLNVNKKQTTSSFSSFKKGGHNNMPSSDVVSCPLTKGTILKASNNNVKEFTINNNNDCNKITIDNSNNNGTGVINENEGNGRNEQGNKNDSNVGMNKYVDILRNVKNLKKLIRKYPQYENDIMNIKNNFKSYEIELNKDENIFINPVNHLYKHFIDFQYDSEAQKNAKLNKKYQLKSKIINQAKKINTFINDFNALIEDNEIRNELSHYHN